MRFSSTIVLAAVVALASSISAMPIDDGAEHCTGLCAHDWQCNTCMAGLSFLLWLSCESYFCFHNSAVWPLALTGELLQH
ncbi:hypothetical protein EDD22DRAFT_871294 [Suillus occidentalis]|nr:hypothetical protein EDD22DRAFT_871294 [Suillus occidentalis]